LVLVMMEVAVAVVAVRHANADRRIDGSVTQ
jgi:hypothetical protein